MVYKRYEFWGSDDGKPVKKVTPWFRWDSDNRDPWQLKSQGLKNEYKEE